MAEITKEQLDAAEYDFLISKFSDDPEVRREAAQAFGDLRTAWKLQEEAAGRRSGFHAPIVSNYEN